VRNLLQFLVGTSEPETSGEAVMVKSTADQKHLMMGEDPKDISGQLMLMMAKKGVTIADKRNKMVVATEEWD
jgi:hypothetical protein